MAGAYWFHSEAMTQEVLVNVSVRNGQLTMWWAVGGSCTYPTVVLSQSEARAIARLVRPGTVGN